MVLTYPALVLDVDYPTKKALSVIEFDLMNPASKAGLVYGNTYFVMILLTKSIFT
jgi:hypothetical protein